MALHNDSPQPSQETTPAGRRSNPKRKATIMKNSRYDESSYLVDFSGKNRRLEDLSMSKQVSSVEDTKTRSSKRLMKQVRKTASKMTESNVIEQIKEIKISDGELAL